MKNSFIPATHDGKCKIFLGVAIFFILFWACRYERITFTVAFNTNGGTVIDSQTIENGQKATPPSTLPEKDGYTFVVWTTDANGSSSTDFDFGTAITANITLYAQYVGIQRTITFQTNGGNAMAPVSVENGRTATKPNDPTKDGYNFEEWNTKADGSGTDFDFANTPITDDITLYARWVGIPRTITFNTNGGNAIDPVSVENGKTATKPADPTKEGYIFTGWFTAATSGTAFDFSEAITKETTVYAQWLVLQTFAVTFDAQGGSAVSSQTIEYGKTATKPADPTKEGYIFTGWFTVATSGTAFDFSEAITKETTVYAQWVSTVLTKENKDDLSSYDEATKTLTVREGVEEIDNLVFKRDSREITKVVLPSTLERIGLYAFDWGELESLEIPDSVKTIGAGAFRDNKISSLTWGSHVESIGNGAFNNNEIASDFVIPDSVKTIGSSAFRNNQISSLTLGSRVEYIGQFAFMDNRIAGDFVIPDSMKTIGKDAFSGNQISSLILGSRVESIGGRAFKNNKIVGTLEIPDSVKTIGGSAFQHNQISSLTLGSGVESIGGLAFGDNQITGALAIPDSVKTIGAGAFQHNQISSLTLGSGVEIIGMQAFYGNQIKGTLEIPGSVKTIGPGAFQDNQISSLTLGSGVKSIGDQAFIANTDLTQVTLLRSDDPLTTIAGDTFASTPLKDASEDATITYPSGADYRNADNWEDLEATWVSSN